MAELGGTISISYRELEVSEAHCNFENDGQLTNGPEEVLNHW